MRKSYKALIFIIALNLLIPTLGFSLDITEIQEAIQNKGASWQAKENPLTKLSFEEKRKLTGLQIPESLQGITLSSLYSPLATLPTSFTWTDNNGFNWLTSVKDQGQCGSCYAFVTCAAVEVITRIARNDANYVIDLSEQHLIACADGDCTSGGNFGVTATYAMNYGIPDEACYPYLEADGLCGDSCADWTSRTYKIDAWKWISLENPDPQTIKEALLEAPVATSMDIYEDFYSYSSGVYEHITGNYVGGHAVLIVGWGIENTKEYWLCKNSWNTFWGIDGYFKIAIGNSAIGRNTITYDCRYPSMGGIWKGYAANLTQRIGYQTDTAYAAVRFVLKPGDKIDYLRLYFVDIGVNWNIRIYEDINQAGQFSGSAFYTDSGISTGKGWEIVPVSPVITVGSGGNIAVDIAYTLPSGSYAAGYPVPLDSDMANSGNSYIDSNGNPPYTQLDYDVLMHAHVMDLSTPTPVNTPTATLTNTPTATLTATATNTSAPPTHTATPFDCIPITECTNELGDCNCDGNISPGDALIAFNVFLEVSLDPCTCGDNMDCVTTGADMDHNGSVTPGDALCVFQTYLGLSCQ